jgi:hypothetical protein
MDGKGVGEHAVALWGGEGGAENSEAEERGAKEWEQRVDGRGEGRTDSRASRSSSGSKEWRSKRGVEAREKGSQNKGKERTGWESMQELFG